MRVLFGDGENLVRSLRVAWARLCEEQLREVPAELQAESAFWFERAPTMEVHWRGCKNDGESRQTRRFLTYAVLLPAWTRRWSVMTLERRRCDRRSRRTNGRLQLCVVSFTTLSFYIREWILSFRLGYPDYWTWTDFLWFIQLGLKAQTCSQHTLRIAAPPMQEIQGPWYFEPIYFTNPYFLILHPF